MSLTQLGREAYMEAEDVCFRYYGVDSGQLVKIAQHFSDSIFNHYEQRQMEPPDEYYLWRMIATHLTRYRKHVLSIQQEDAKAKAADARVVHTEQPSLLEATQ